MKNEKKFGAHTHFTQHMTLKCCNITTTVNNASIIKIYKKTTKQTVMDYSIATKNPSLPF